MIGWTRRGGGKTYRTEFHVGCVFWQIRVEVEESIHDTNASISRIDALQESSRACEEMAASAI